MGRYSTTQAAPPEPTLEGDSSFTALNMKLERSQLEPGTLSRAMNNRLRKGVAEPRKGVLPAVAFNVIALGALRGAGVYSNPNKDEVLLVATAANKVYALRDGTYPREIAVAAGFTFDGPVEFVQAHDKIFIFRGTEEPQLVWDGIAAAGFVKITKKDPMDTSTKLIPPAVTAEPASDRLLIIDGANDVLATDIADYTSYDHIDEVFHVGREAGDPIVRVFHYAKALEVVFCRRSSYLLGNYTKDPTLHTIELLNSQLGLAGRKAVTMAGADFLFLSEPGGIYRGTQSFENRQEVLMKPVSDPIQPLIDRINWRAASGAVAATLGEYVFFAVPIDGAVRNNALIVFNGATGVFEGYDTWPAPFAIDELQVTLFQGTRRLFAIDKTLGRIYVLNEGQSDFIWLDAETMGRHEIRHLIETRGYATLGWNGSTLRDFRLVQVSVATWRPSLMITELTEKAGDERPRNINPITKSRTEYDRFGVPDWDPSNANDDWATPGRQDYSIVTSEEGILPGTQGLALLRKQNYVLRFSTKCRARYVSFRIENSQGSADVSGVLVESAGVPRQTRRGA